MAKDKLNPIRTKFDITIDIDDVDYKVTFKPVNKIIQEKLNLGMDETKAQYEDVDNKRVKLKEIKELKSINDEILKTHGEKGGIGTEQKTEMLLANKKYISEISALEKEIANLEKDVLDVNSAIENHFKKMFDECVSGENKVRLQETIEDNGIAYSIVIAHLNESLRVAQEKK